MTVNWLGYDFSVHRIDEDWNAVGGLYIFVGLKTDWQGSSQWHALYVGKTQDFSTRLPSHPMWGEAAQHGAMYVHARVEANSFLRAMMEQELIRRLQPVLNVRLK